MCQTSLKRNLLLKHVDVKCLIILFSKDTLRHQIQTHISNPTFTNAYFEKIYIIVKWVVLPFQRNIICLCAHVDFLWNSNDFWRSLSEHMLRKKSCFLLSGLALLLHRKQPSWCICEHRLVRNHNLIIIFYSVCLFFYIKIMLT